jgi:hypothetical protein
MQYALYVWADSFHTQRHSTSNKTPCMQYALYVWADSFHTQLY